MTSLEAVGIEKNLSGSTVLTDFSIQVKAGEIVGLLGANGAGKTTAISILSGTLEPDRGKVCVFGSDRDPFNSEQNALIGLVPQEIAIYPGLTVRENLDFFGRFYESDRNALQRQIEQSLLTCRLFGVRDERVETLSSGMKRRLNLAVALVHEPRILLLDEATVGLDYPSRAQLFETLRELSDEGRAILFATHLFDEIELLCARAVLLDHGRIRETVPKGGLSKQEVSSLFNCDRGSK